MGIKHFERTNHWYPVGGFKEIYISTHGQLRTDKIIEPFIDDKTSIVYIELEGKMYRLVDVYDFVFGKSKLLQEVIPPKR